MASTQKPYRALAPYLENWVDPQTRPGATTYGSVNSGRSSNFRPSPGFNPQNPVHSAPSYQPAARTAPNLLGGPTPVTAPQPTGALPGDPTVIRSNIRKLLAMADHLENISGPSAVAPGSGTISATLPDDMVKNAVNSPRLLERNPRDPASAAAMYQVHQSPTPGTHRISYEGPSGYLSRNNGEPVPTAPSVLQSDRTKQAADYRARAQELGAPLDLQDAAAAAPVAQQQAITESIRSGAGVTESPQERTAKINAASREKVAGMNAKGGPQSREQMVYDMAKAYLGSNFAAPEKIGPLLEDLNKAFQKHAPEGSAAGTPAGQTASAAAPAQAGAETEKLINGQRYIRGTGPNGEPGWVRAK